MSDDLDLRLRTLRNLSWEESDRIEHPWYLDPTKTVTVIAYTRGDESGRICLLDGEPKWGHEWTVPDYPNNLGACAEVLDAARHRRWHGMFDMAEEEPHKYVHTATFFDLILAHNTWASATAPTLPAAICLAFCEAVEANTIPSTG